MGEMDAVKDEMPLCRSRERSRGREGREELREESEGIFFEGTSEGSDERRPSVGEETEEEAAVEDEETEEAAAVVVGEEVDGPAAEAEAGEEEEAAAEAAWAEPWVWLGWWGGGEVGAGGVARARAQTS